MEKILINSCEGPLWVMENEYTITPYNNNIVIIRRWKLEIFAIKQTDIRYPEYIVYIPHRLDGPAFYNLSVCTWESNSCWYIYGKEYTKEGHAQEVERLKLLQDKSIECGLELTF